MYASWVKSIGAWLLRQIARAGLPHSFLTAEHLGTAVLAGAGAVLLSTVLWLTYILSGEKRAFKKAFKPFWSTFRTALTDPVKGAQAGFEQARDVLRDLLKDPNDTEHPLPVALQDAVWTAARPLRRVARREGKLQEFDAALTSAGSVALSVETLASLYPHTDRMSEAFLAAAAAAINEPDALGRVAPVLANVYPNLFAQVEIAQTLVPLLTALIRDEARESGHTTRRMLDVVEGLRREANLRPGLRLKRYLPLSAGQIANLPTRLVVAEHGVVPFIPLSSVADDLLVWAQTGEGVSGKLIAGPGGYGKTRLAIHIAQTLYEKGWQQSGLISATDWSNSNVTAELSVMMHDPGSAGVLLIIDYAECRIPQIRSVVRTAMAAQNDEGVRPVRILLLARSAGINDETGWHHQAGDWWHALLDERGADTSPERLCFTVEPIIADAINNVPPSRRREWVELAAVAIETALRRAGQDSLIANPEKRQPITDERLASFEASSPLLLVFEAFLHVRSTDMRGSPLAEMAREESRHWLRALGDSVELTSPCGRAMQFAVAALTLCRGLPASETQTLAGLACSLVFPSDADPREVAHTELKIGQALEQLYGEEDLQPVTPDLLGEQIVGESLAIRPELLGVLLDHRPQSALDIFQILNRISRLQEDGTSVHDVTNVVQPVQDAVVSALTAQQFAAHIHSLMAAARIEPGRIQDAACTAFDALPELLKPTVGWGILETEQRSGYRAGTVPPRLRQILCKGAAASLDDSLNDQIDLIAAHLGLDEVGMQTALADYAMTAAIMLGQGGKTLEAVRAAQRAASTYEKLAQHSPGEYEVSLGAALNALALLHSRVGAYDAAIETCQRAISRFECSELEEDAAAVARLATVLLNYSNLLAGVGRTPESVESAEKSVRLYKQLLGRTPSLPVEEQLAGALGNLASGQWESGHRERAIQTAQEALQILMVLYQQSPSNLMMPLCAGLMRSARFCAATENYARASQYYLQAATLLAPARQQLTPDEYAQFIQTVGYYKDTAQRAGLSPEEVDAKILAATGLEVRPVSDPDADDPTAWLQEAQDHLNFIRERWADNPYGLAQQIAPKLVEFATKVGQHGKYSESLEASVEAETHLKLLRTLNADMHLTQLAITIYLQGLALVNLHRPADVAECFARGLRLISSAPSADLAEVGRTYISLERGFIGVSLHLKKTIEQIMQEIDSLCDSMPPMIRIWNGWTHAHNNNQDTTAQKIYDVLVSLLNEHIDDRTLDMFRDKIQKISEDAGPAWTYGDPPLLRRA